MKRVAALMVAVVASLIGAEASACSIPGKVWPTSTELAASSEWVFVAHVEHVYPLGERDEAFLRNFPSSVTPGVPFTFPTAAAEFSLLRSLKGDPVPAASRLRSSAMNCSGVFLEQGGDYMIFANKPEHAGDDIAPIKGSFKLYDTQNVLAGLQGLDAKEALAKVGDIASQSQQANIREVQARIHSQSPTTP